MNKAKDKQQQFEKNCRILGLKTLQEQYRELTKKAIAAKIGHFEFIYDIVQQEAACKKQRRIEYLIKNSRLPCPLNLLDDFDFDFQPKLDRRLIAQLATMEFIENSESILFIGDPGTGKSHLARSLSLIACQSGCRVHYTTCSDLIVDLNAGVFEKNLDARLKKYIKCDLLVIDEMGHDRLELQVTKEAHLLFKVIDQRYRDKKSLIFTTNITEVDWPEFLGDPVSTAAILDRIFHHSVIVSIEGPSYRKHQSRLLQERYRQKNSRSKDQHTGA